MQSPFLQVSDHVFAQYHSTWLSYLTSPLLYQKVLKNYTPFLILNFQEYHVNTYQLINPVRAEKKEYNQHHILPIHPVNHFLPIFQTWNILVDEGYMAFPN